MKIKFTNGLEQEAFAFLPFVVWSWGDKAVSVGWLIFAWEIGYE